MAKEENLFKRLTTLFRSGPSINRKVKSYKTFPKGTSFDSFKKARTGLYNHAMSAYGSYDRAARYADFSEMEYMPEIASALDIYAEESTSPDERGKILHIYSENPKIKQILEELFYDVLNVDFNLASWVRTMCKYGDFFLFNDVDPEIGIINAYPIPVNEVEREEGFDPDEPMAVRFRWLTQGNQILENWQISHFRLLGNDAFLPYGSSMLEPARRIWRQLILIEDAMLVYRVIRSPERRVFYVDVGNVAPEEVANYMEQVQSSLKRAKVVDKSTGRVDLRFNPLSVDEDYFIPVRGGESGTRIDTLAGGTNQNDINDVEYIQKKLFAALKIPKAYLGYDEALSSKATLAQEDIRFSRLISKIQRTILSELNKLAIVNLYIKGYDNDDLLNFSLQLSNPSSIAQQQKLELWSTKFTIAGSVPEGMVDKRWIRKNILGLTDKDITLVEEGREEDKIRELELETLKMPGQTGPEGGGDPGGFDPGAGGGGGLFGDDAGGDLFGGGGDDAAAGGGDAAPDAGAEPGPENASLLRGEELVNEEDFLDEVELDDEDLPVDNPTAQSSGKKRRRKRRSDYNPLNVPGKQHKTDMGKSTLKHMNLNPGSSLKDLGSLTDNRSLSKQDLLSEYYDEMIEVNSAMHRELNVTLKSLDKNLGNRRKNSILNESKD